VGGAAYAVVLQFYACVTTAKALYAAGISSVVLYYVIETGADGMRVQLSAGCPKVGGRCKSTATTVYARLTVRPTVCTQVYCNYVQRTVSLSIRLSTRCPHYSYQS
jgi:hypothetical protein